MSKSHSRRRFYGKAAENFAESPLAFRHLAELSGHAAEAYGNRPAFTTQLPNGSFATIDFSDADRLSSQFAVYLREVAGLQQGDVVAVMSPNCIGFALAVCGIFKAGCICTNINPLYTAVEMEHQLRDSGAGVLVIIDLFGDKADTVVSRTNVRQVVTLSLLDFFPPLRRMVMAFVMTRVKKMVPRMRTPHITVDEALKRGDAILASSRIDVPDYRAGQGPDDTALYQYTGGTTGRSKGAELTHRNILLNAAAAESLVSELLDYEAGECSLVVLPMYHITAFALILVPAIEHGMHCVMIPNPRPPSNLKTAFENHPVSHFLGINTLYAALLEEPWCTAGRLAHLKFCGSGGAAQHTAIAERWEALTGLPVYQGYGLTEVAGALTLNPPGHNRVGFVGVPLPCTVVRIVDESGRECPRGEPGEVIAKGPSVMKGYLGNPEATAETIRDGWLYTGDIGTMDEDGFVRIVDRKKDMILVSGFNVYPNEIENVISRIESVSEVGVVGIPDEKTGEAVKAFIVSADPGLTAERVLEHCRAELTNYKRPVQIEFVEEIPKTPVGKILRRQLREGASKPRSES